jgi:hypothetical protein
VIQLFDMPATGYERSHESHHEVPMNRIARLVVLTVAVSLAGANFAARAGESKEDEVFQKRPFARVLGDKQTHACFSRAYDAGHLAQHLQQNVRTMLLLVSAKSEADSGPSYELRINVTFRKSDVHFESAGDCGSIHDAADAGRSSAVAHCGVDCDGGSLDVAIKNENRCRFRYRRGLASGAPAATTIREAMGESTSAPMIKSSVSTRWR